MTLPAGRYTGGWGLAGGMAGILIGVAIPLSVNYFVESVSIPMSPISILVAFSVSLMVACYPPTTPRARRLRFE